MKIAILTLPLHKNIGGILQLYALLAYLKNNGHEVLVINRGFNKAKTSVGGVLNNVIIQPLIAFNINKFIGKYIVPKTKKIDASEQLSIVNELGIKTVIVGSDQVWRIDYVPDWYKDYFLEFVRSKDIKKISYAASFGSHEWNYPDSITNEVKALLQDFSAISAREKSGVNICKNIFGIDKVEHVLDPTLLLEKNDYLKLLESKKNKKHNGILTYFLDLDEKKENISRFVSNELNLCFFSVNVERTFSKKEIFQLHKCIHPSIENWISGFNQCEFVITDSFHGVVFAIIFEKPFIAIANEKRGIDRFISLLDIIGLRRRLVFDFEGITKELVHESIDFNEVNRALSICKNESKNYLLSNI